MPWRHWSDIVAFFASDELDAFEQFLALACSWDDAPTPPPPASSPPRIETLLDQIGASPEMFRSAVFNSLSR
jgi:hypothetical protein